MMRQVFLPILVALAALASIWVGWTRLEGAVSDLAVTTSTVDGIPVTVFRPRDPANAPMVIVAHGFAGSQQLMLPFAVTLAENGYVVVTFDQPGHGRNPAPLRGGLSDDNAASSNLLAALAKVDAYARTLGPGDIALVGHSMAADIDARYAQAHNGLRAQVGVSLFSPGVTAERPRNLLIVDGALEPPMLTDEAARLVRLVAGDNAAPETTYGSFADGTARRYALAPGVEHIGVLYSRHALAETLAWLDSAFGRQGNGTLDARGPALGFLFAGLVALAWPLSRLLPRLADHPAQPRLGWKRFLPIAIAPAILTPLILWKTPTGFLPILLGDYLTVHFALYGALTAAFLLRAGVRPSAWRPGAGALACGAVVALYAILALGLPLDRFVDSYWPIAVRLPLILAVLVGTLIYFAANEVLVRGAPPFAALITGLCFVVSLGIAVALNPPRLFFLIIIIPIILLFLIIYGLLARWTYARTGDPLAGAVGVALALAWGIGVTFPMLG